MVCGMGLCDLRSLPRASPDLTAVAAPQRSGCLSGACPGRACAQWADVPETFSVVRRGRRPPCRESSGGRFDEAPRASHIASGCSRITHRSHEYRPLRRVLPHLLPRWPAWPACCPRGVVVCPVAWQANALDARALHSRSHGFLERASYLTLHEHRPLRRLLRRWAACWPCAVVVCPVACRLVP